MAAVLTLAVGIAGTTAMFAIVHGVLLRPLPVRDQQRLIVAWKALPAAGHAHWPFRAPEIDVLRRHGRVLETVAAVSYYCAGREGALEDGAGSHLSSTLVTGDVFEVLGVQPMLGRALSRPTDRPGAEHVLVITHGLWQRRYGGFPDALGRRIVLDERPFTIVGVMPPDVDNPRGVEAVEDAQLGHRRVRVRGRGAAGCGPGRAAARGRDDRTRGGRVPITDAAVRGRRAAGHTARARAGRAQLRGRGGRRRPPGDAGAVRRLYAVMAAYVRQRYREIGVRIALGATVSDVRRLVLGEGLRPSALGVAFGLAGAAAGTRLLRGLLFDVHPLDPASMGGAALLLVAVSALASLVPAWRATRLDPAATLRAE